MNDEPKPNLLDEIVAGIRESEPANAKARARWERRQLRYMKYDAIPVQSLSEVEKEDIPNERMKLYWQGLVADGRVEEAAEFWRRHARLPQAPRSTRAPLTASNFKIRIEYDPADDPAFDKLREEKRKKFNEAVNRHRR